MRKQKGFSLIELLIVVAIILIIAAIAVPSLLRSKMLANESAAASTIRTLNTAESTYQSTYGIGFAAQITNLGGAVPCTATSTTACLIDETLSTATPGKKQGFQYTAVGTGGGGTASSPILDFVSSANPIVVGTSGNRRFCSSSDFVIRFDTTAPGTNVATPSACRTGENVLQNN